MSGLAGARRWEATPVSDRGRQARGRGTGHAGRQRTYRWGPIRGRGPFLALDRPAKDQSSSCDTEPETGGSERMAGHRERGRCPDGGVLDAPDKRRASMDFGRFPPRRGPPGSQRSDDVRLGRGRVPHAARGVPAGVGARAWGRSPRCQTCSTTPNLNRRVRTSVRPRRLSSGQSPGEVQTKMIKQRR